MQLVPSPSCSTTVVDGAHAVERITAPTCSALFWPRRLGERVLDEAADVARGELELAGALDLDTDPTAHWLTSSLPSALAAQLESDVVMLGALLARLLRRRHLWCSLTVVRTDACRKFHADFVSLRGLVTYAGPGTEWADADVVDRSAMGRADLDVATANALIVPNARGLRCAAAGDVLLLKGDAYPGARGQGAVHRSPPIEATHRRRLILKLDANRCGC